MSRLFLLLLFASATSLAPPVRAEEPAVDDAPPVDPAAMAESLGIVGTSEAVLLVVAETPVDQLMVGGREIALAPSADGVVRRVVRDQPEGFVSVSVVRGGRVWEGQVRTFAGQVTEVDADELLASGEARDARAEDSEEFDLFAFYDELDARKDDAARLEHCAEVLASSLSDADRRVVSETCDRIEAALAEEQAPVVDDVEAADLGDLLLDEGDSDVERSRERQLRQMYRRDGRPRLVAPGTLPRVIAIGVGSAGVGFSTYSALYWEFQAEQEYVGFRDAERVGDDAAMTRHLFFSRRYDRNRDASIAVGTAFVLGTAVAAIFQGVENRRFQRRRQALVETRDD